MHCFPPERLGLHIVKDLISFMFSVEADLIHPLLERQTSPKSPDAPSLDYDL